MEVREALEIARSAIWDRMHQIDPSGKQFGSREMKELGEAIEILERLMEE